MIRGTRAAITAGNAFTIAGRGAPVTPLADWWRHIVDNGPGIVHSRRGSKSAPASGSPQPCPANPCPSSVAASLSSFTMKTRTALDRFRHAPVASMCRVSRRGTNALLFKALTLSDGPQHLPQGRLPAHAHAAAVDRYGLADQRTRRPVHHGRHTHAMRAFNCLFCTRRDVNGSVPSWRGARLVIGTKKEHTPAMANRDLPRRIKDAAVAMAGGPMSGPSFSQTGNFSAWRWPIVPRPRGKEAARSCPGIRWHSPSPWRPPNIAGN
ncbi:hypothetical protein J2852_006172 [Azospirillum soli]|nr:hypothetical protein [Azospirillum soli]